MHLATLALSLLASIAPTQDFGAYHALVIGNNAYQQQPKLVTAVEDAKAVAKLLKEGYDFDVQLLLDASRQQISDALWSLQAQLTESDNLLIYYAGHGFEFKAADEGYWLGVDAGETPSNWLGNAAITSALKANRARHIMIVSDSCYSGKLARGITVTGSGPDYYREMSKLKARVVLTAGGLEPVSDSGRDGHSVFAYEFLKSLAANEAILDGTTLFKEVQRPVMLAARQTPNYGDIRECGHDGGDFLFVRKNGAAPTPPPPLAPIHLVRGHVEQRAGQVSTISVEGHAAENRVFGSEDFVLPVSTEEPSLVLVASVDGEERARRTLDVRDTSHTERFQGRPTPVHDLGNWRIPTLPIYVEGRLELPPGAGKAHLRLAQDLSQAEDFDSKLHVLEASPGSGAFRLILPDTGQPAELIVSAEGCKQQTLALRFDRAESGYRGTRRAQVLNLGELRLESTQPAVAPVSLDALKERASYSQLNQAQVTALAHAAEARWEAQFAGFTFQRVERFSAGGVSHWMAIWSHAQTGLEFVLVPGGKFQMGSPSSEADRDDDEKQNWVTLDPFLMARTECTQGAWAKVARGTSLNGTPSYFKGSERLPVEQVSAEDADIWCREARLMLPTEAQAEFVIRAGTMTAWTMSGDKNDLRRFGNIGSAECPKDWIDKGWTESWRDGYGDQSAEVGKFEANAFGLFDVHGNVWEWCRDFYLDYGVGVEKGTGLRPGTSARRVSRGGGFGRAARVARSAHRDRSEPGYRGRNLGFRPAVDLPF